MGSKPKAPKAPKPIAPPKAAAPVEEEDEIASSAGNAERKRLAAMQGRGDSVTSRGGRIAEFGASILG